MSLIGIYKISSPDNKIYIGQSWDIELRFNKHYKNAGLCKNQPKLSHSFELYGRDKHVFEILELVNPDINQSDFNELEQFYMDLYKEMGFDLLNLRRAGNRGKHSPETIKKMKGLSTKWLTGQKLSKETKLKMSLAQKGIPKPPRSKQHCENLSKSHIGHTWSTNQRKPIEQLSLDGEFIKKWESSNAIKKFLGIKNCNFIRVCQGKSRQAKGFIWRYAL